MQSQQASRVFTNADIARLNEGQQPMGTEVSPGGAPMDAARFVFGRRVLVLLVCSAEKVPIPK